MKSGRGMVKKVLRDKLLGDDPFWETARTVFYAVLIAVVVRTFAYEPFNIPSGSMYPTLMVGDYLFVSKFSYGYSKYSIPYGLDLFDGRVFSNSPKRGDVAVFKLPRDNSTDYIKRIVGLPRDRIQVKDGVLYINNCEHSRGVGSDILGHPLEALAWLANHRAGLGRPLRAGTFVMLGSVVETVFFDSPAEVSVLLEGVGEARVKFV